MASVKDFWTYNLMYFVGDREANGYLTDHDSHALLTHNELIPTQISTDTLLIVKESIPVFLEYFLFRT